MAGLQLSGLASGLDWQSIVDKLMEIESVSVTRLEKEKTTNTSRNDALSGLNTKMEALQDAVNALNNKSLYTKRGATSSLTGSTWSLSAADSTATGSYKVNVSQLATSAQLQGAKNLSKPLDPSSLVSALSTGTAITAGEFSVNGAKVSIALTDTLDDVLTRISTATSGEVTASYDEATDSISLTNTVPGRNVVLGAANDTSNFLGAMRLRNNGTATVVSTEDPTNLGVPVSGLGTASLSNTIANAGLNGTLSAQSGTFKINGVELSYDSSSESLSAIITKINNSSAGVTASYDSVNDRMTLVNNVTGDIGFTVQDSSGNLMETLGLTTAAGASLQAGKDAIYTVNDGGTLYSRSNTLDSSSHGITGLSLTVKSQGTETITVSADTSGASKAIDTFISKFNDVQDYIDTKTKITTTDGKVTTAILANNYEVNEYARRLRSYAFTSISGLAGTVDQLDDLGIDFRSGTNKLELKDSSKLNSALSSNATGVMDFFTNSTSGFVNNFGGFFKSALGTGSADGSLDVMVKNLASSNKSIDAQIETLERQLESKRSTLEAAFIAMEEASSRSQNILTQLTNTFSKKSS